MTDGPAVGRRRSPRPDESQSQGARRLLGMLAFMVAAASPPNDTTSDVCGAHRKGEAIGRYVLTRRIGAGAAGDVWVAQDPLLAIPVALKLLRPAGAGWFGAARLLREGRAAAGLKHPAIVQVLDFGTSAQGEAYLALELLTGETLTDFAAGTRVAPELAARLLLPLLDALALAHEHGIVHRDIKPDNLFIARDEKGRLQPKMLDFGVARSCTPGAERLTLPGRTVGSPAYMAPEQARGEEDVDGRADLWAVAVTMYELVSGRLPFTGGTIPLLLAAIVAADPPPLTSVPGVDDELGAIVACAMSKCRDDRFVDARAMGKALARWLLSRGILEDACGTSLRQRWLGEPCSDRVAARPRASTGSLRPATLEESRQTLQASDSGRPTSSSVAVRAQPPARRHRGWLAAVAACAAISGALVAARPMPASTDTAARADDGVTVLSSVATGEETADVAPPAVAPPAAASAERVVPSASASTSKPPSRSSPYPPGGTARWF